MYFLQQGCSSGVHMLDDFLSSYENTSITPDLAQTTGQRSNFTETWLGETSLIRVVYRSMGKKHGRLWVAILPTQSPSQQLPATCVCSGNGEPHGPPHESKKSRLQLQAGNRENELEKKIKSYTAPNFSSEVLPPARQNLLNVPKQPTNWGQPSVCGDICYTNHYTAH